MMLATIGWSIVHALWIGVALGGATALCLGLVTDHRAPLRYRLAYFSLMLMVVAPLAMAIATVDVFTPPAREQVTWIVETTIGLPALVEWRARVVRGAAVLWLAGVTVHMVRVGLEWRRLRQFTHMGIGDAGPAARALVSRLATELGVRGSVTILGSSRAVVPMVFGWRHPRLLLPSAATRAIDPGQLRAVLAHELAHVRRRDYVANLLQVGAEALLWFHPAAHWVSQRVRTEREYCCDDVAIGVGVEATDYAHALAALDEARDECRLVVAAASGTLLDRIQRIVGHPRPVLTPARGLLAFLAALVVASAIVTLTMVVPPGIPLDARLRSMSAGPPGASTPAPTEPSFPRTRQR